MQSTGQENVLGISKNHFKVLLRQIFFLKFLKNYIFSGRSINKIENIEPLNYFSSLIP